jgi:hypothetical protein
MINKGLHGPLADRVGVERRDADRPAVEVLRREAALADREQRAVEAHSDDSGVAVQRARHRAARVRHSGQKAASGEALKVRVAATPISATSTSAPSLSCEHYHSHLDSLENDFIAVKATRDGGAIRRFTPLVWCGYETKPESRFLEIVSARKYSLIVPKLYAGSAGCDDKVGFAAGFRLPEAFRGCLA